MLFLYKNVQPESSNTKPNQLRAKKRPVPPLSIEEQHDILSRIKKHHTNPDGTLTHVNIRLLPIPTPHVGSNDCNIKTRQRRSKVQEQLLQQLSTPSTVTSPTEKAKHEQAQLTALIKRNKDTVTACAEAAGVKVLHKLSVDDH